jgi:hypothetical protein
MAEVARDLFQTKLLLDDVGDNRHNSEDSRWGFVPENHIVGKPVFIWLSWDTNGKGLNKYAGIEFSQLAVKGNHNRILNIS